MTLALSPEQFRSIFPRASRSTLEANGIVSNAKPESDEEKPLVIAVSRKTKGVRRIRVLFTLYRVHLLDDDGAQASIKDLLDGLRHASLLPDDDPGTIELTTCQEKVKSFSEERTEVDIFWPEERIKFGNQASGDTHE